MREKADHTKEKQTMAYPSGLLHFLDSSSLPIRRRLRLVFLDEPCMGAVIQSSAARFLGQHRSSGSLPIRRRLWLVFLDEPCMGAVIQSSAARFLGQHRRGKAWTGHH